MQTKPTKETLKQWHNDPCNWRFGIFYFNKKDKRLLPPKRIGGLGWTVNFANPFSIFIAAVIITIAIAVGLLIK